MKYVQFLYEPGDGGLDRVAILLANEMTAQGHDCELWMARGEGPVAHLIANKVTVRIIPAPRIGGRGLHLFMQIPALAREIAKAGPDAIFSAGNQSNLTIALAGFLDGSGQTAIIQKITNPIERPGMGAVRRFFRRLRFGFTARLADLVLTLSQADATEYGALYPKAAQRFAAVRNAYVTPAMLEAGEGRAERAPSAVPQLLAVGRIAVQKDYATMMRAMARITDHAWHLTVIGDGPLMAETQALAADLGIADRITFNGFVADPTPIYAVSDLLVLSSRWEGFPAVPLEAMAAGCDVVATDCAPGLTEMMAGAGRKTVPIGDDAALGQAIVEAIAKKHDAAMRDIAQAYSIKASAQDHLRLAAKVLEGQINDRG